MRRACEDIAGLALSLDVGKEAQTDADPEVDAASQTDAAADTDSPAGPDEAISAAVADLGGLAMLCYLGAGYFARKGGRQT